MKTIMIVIAGMADLPGGVVLRETPLTMAHIPSLDLLAQRGTFTAFHSVAEGETVTHVNALLSILGYDLQRGEPKVEELMEFGLDNSRRLTDYESLRTFIIPGFSGHGVCVTPSAWVRGVAKSTFLKPLDIYSPGSSDAELLGAMAKLACESIVKEEFVLVYVDSPLKASLRGDYEGKVRSLELIDRHLIAPIADYVWKSELLINMAVTTDLVTPWHRRRPTMMRVPVVVYFNNHDWEGDKALTFTEVTSMLSERNLNHPSDLIRYLSNFYVTDEDPPSEY